MGTLADSTLAPATSESPAEPLQRSDAANAEACAPELSIVMPCLNEADTLAACIAKAQCAMSEADIDGEVIVADNGSTDGSCEIALRMGARLVRVPTRGYGSALMGGIAAARGRYVLMGDADDSYDFLEAPKFVERLREGYDLVQGCRLPSGAGTVRPGAMPFLHRWIGNPGLTLIARWFFRVPVNDVYCGMRAFTKELYGRLNQRCTGMEFATEMIVKSARFEAKISEVPITLHPDGRTSHPPHLRTFRDGWRTLRLFLIYAPRWLFLEPGKLLVLLGLIGFALGLPGARIGSVHFSLNTLVFASLAVLCGCQAILFALGTKVFAAHAGLLPNDARVEAFYKRFTLERGLLVSAASLLAGLALLLWAVNQWRLAGFGDLDYEATTRWVITGATLVALGAQLMLSSFFLTVLGVAPNSGSPSVR